MVKLFALWRPTNGLWRDPAQGSRLRGGLGDSAKYQRCSGAGRGVLRIQVAATRPNLYGQTAMFFYLVHRLVLDISATYLGLRGSGGLLTAYVVAPVLLVALYPMCRWYRSYKNAHRDSWLQYFCSMLYRSV